MRVVTLTFFIAAFAFVSAAEAFAQLTFETTRDCAAQPKCEPSCDSLSCPLDASCSVWRFQVSNLLMTRNDPGNIPLLTQDNNVLLNANQFDFGIKSGIDAGLRRSLNQDWDLDGRFFWLSDFRNGNSAFVPGTSIIEALNAPTVLVLSGPAAFDANYRSAVHTAEINLRRKHCNFGLLAGFRYVDLNERFTELFLSANGGNLTESAIAVQTENHLYGFQLGADSILWQNSRGARVEGVAKGGLYGNHAQSQFSLGSFTTTSSLVLSGTDTKDQAAFLGELGLSGVLPVTKHLSIRGGYQMMWLEGVALAINQSQRAGFPVAIDSNDGLFYHGSNAGLELTW